MLITEFAYNNTKNNRTGYTSFELNCGFHLKISYKEDVDPYSKPKNVDQLAIELHTLMSIYMENL